MLRARGDRRAPLLPQAIQHADGQHRNAHEHADEQQREQQRDTHQPQRDPQERMTRAARCAEAGETEAVEQVAAAGGHRGLVPAALGRHDTMPAVSGERPTEL
jgi:hypothetical protein